MKKKLDDIAIRTNYKPGDIGLITYMHGVFHDYGQIFEMYVAETLADFYRSMDQSKERIWIAESNHQIIGTIALKNTENQAQLRYFLISPEFRGIGLGKQMMDLFMQFMHQCGYTSSFLLTEDKLKTAALLYEKYGYLYVSSNVTDFGLKENRFELII